MVRVIPCGKLSLCSFAPLDEERNAVTSFICTAFFIPERSPIRRDTLTVFDDLIRPRAALDTVTTVIAFLEGEVLFPGVGGIVIGGTII